jgi:hypothetical protein
MRESSYGLLLLAAFCLMIVLAVYLNKRTVPSTYESMHEKLVFSAEGCKVYQVTIKNEYGTDQLYVALNPAASERPTTAHPTCRITR